MLLMIILIWEIYFRNMILNAIVINILFPKESPSWALLAICSLQSSYRGKQQIFLCSYLQPIDGRPAMSSPMNTLLLGLTMYDTLLIVTSVMMVGVPSIHTHSSYVIDTQPHDRSESRASNGGKTKVREYFTITEKAPTRAFSWQKAPTSAFTFKTQCQTGVNPQ